MSSQRSPYCHKNRHGEVYYVDIRRPTGERKRYVMVKDRARAMDALPDGYEVRESINGHVSIGRRRARHIREAEESLVRAALRRIRPFAYELEVGRKSLTIFASSQDWKCFSESVDAEFSAGFAAALEEMFERRYGRELADLFRARRLRRDGHSRRPRFYPLLRFELVDRTRRIFRVRRICFTGDSDWLDLQDLPLPAAVMRYVPHLGRDSFFNLM